jgi:serine/threonine-protein kinase
MVAKGAGAASRSSGTQAVQASSVVDQLKLGAVVNGKYRIVSILGRGSMGVVAECEHVELHERVALKFLLTRGNVAGEDFGIRFAREAQLSAKLKGSHIARVVDVGVWLDSLPYMVMEYLEGTDLAHVLRASGKLSLDAALEYTVQICEGLAEAHSYGVVHRDLKPSNVFVTRQADGSDLIKILDFGVSKWNMPDREEDPDEGTQAGLILGSPKYMAPEQMFTASKVDPRADVWSIGAVLYQMTTGRPPFDFPTFAQTFAEVASDRPPPAVCAQNADVPPELERVILQCFERMPEKRPQSVAELAGALLESVGSPLAAATRVRIESILSSRTNRDGSIAGQSSSSRIRVAQHDAPAPAWMRGSAMAASASMRENEAPPAKGPRRAVAIGVILVGLALLGAFAAPSLLHGKQTDTRSESTATPPPPATAPEVEPAPSAAEAMPAPSGAPAAGSFLAAVPGAAAADSAAAEAKSAAHSAQVRVQHVAAPPPRPIVTATVAAVAPSPAPKSDATAKKNCDPPFVLSADGVKTYKPECF